MLKRKCLSCQVEIEEDRIRRHPNIKYCSAKCYSEANSKYFSCSRHGDERSKMGSASELAVASEFLTMGWNVFRSLSPCGVVDLIALKGDRCLKIEVKTGTRHATTNNISYATPSHQDFDVLAVYVPEIYAVHFLVEENSEWVDWELK